MKEELILGIIIAFGIVGIIGILFGIILLETAILYQITLNKGDKMRCPDGMKLIIIGWLILTVR